MLGAHDTHDAIYIELKHDQLNSRLFPRSSHFPLQVRSAPQADRVCAGGLPKLGVLYTLACSAVINECLQPDFLISIENAEISTFSWREIQIFPSLDG